MKAGWFYLFLAVAILRGQELVVRTPGNGITVEVDGRPIGTPTLDLRPGPGVIVSCTDNFTQNRIDCASAVNTAVMPTHETIHENENYCFSSNRTTSYACSLPHRKLTHYHAGMSFLLTVDTSCGSTCSLNIDNNGSISLKMIDGTTDPRGTLVAGQPQWIFYDGAVFRLMGIVSTRDGRGDLVARRLIGSMDALAYSPTITLDVTAGDMHKITTINGLGDAVVNATTRWPCR